MIKDLNTLYNKLALLITIWGIGIAIILAVSANFTMRVCR